MSTLTVVAPSDARSAGAVDAVVASLPLSLALATNRGDLLAVAGLPGWTKRVRQGIDTGYRGILVVDPSPEDPTDLLGSGVPIVLDHAFAAIPGLDGFRGALERIEQDALLEVRVTSPIGSSIDTVLMGHMALVRSASSPVRSAKQLLRAEYGYSLRGTLRSGRAVLMTAVLGDARAASASLRAIGTDQIADVQIPSPASARPVCVTVSTSEGSNLLPTRYETAHRAAWRRLHDLVVTSGTSPDLLELSEDVAVMASLSKDSTEPEMQGIR